MSPALSAVFQVEIVVFLFILSFVPDDNAAINADSPLEVCSMISWTESKA